MVKRNKTGLYIGIGVAVIAVIVVIVAVIIIRNNSNNGGEGEGANGPVVTITDQSENIEDIEEFEVIFGDYVRMEKLSKIIQGGVITGKSVNIDGIVSHPAAVYTIAQKDSSGAVQFGVEFEIEGADASAYPNDGERIVLKGKVVEKSPDYYVIQAKADDIEKK